jgi:hypothetical protein
MPMVVYCCSYSLCAFSLLVLNIVVASCWLSSGDVESSVLLLLHARTHLKYGKKKKIAPVLRVVVVTRRSLQDDEIFSAHVRGIDQPIGQR